jgi:hypothetical protein
LITLLLAAAVVAAHLTCLDMVVAAAVQVDYAQQLPQQVVEGL